MSEYKYDAFLSHNSKDKTEVNQIRRALAQMYNLSLFQDETHLIPGEMTLPKLAEALAESACFVVFFGRHGIGPIQEQEISLALELAIRLDLKLVGVLLPGCQVSDLYETVAVFFATRGLIEFSEDTGDLDALHRLFCGIRSLRPNAVPTGNPHPETDQPSECLTNRGGTASDYPRRISISYGESQLKNYARMVDQTLTSIHDACEFLRLVVSRRSKDRRLEGFCREIDREQIQASRALNEIRNNSENLPFIWDDVGDPGSPAFWIRQFLISECRLDFRYQLSSLTPLDIYQKLDHATQYGIFSSNTDRHRLEHVEEEIQLLTSEIKRMNSFESVVICAQLPCMGNLLSKGFRANEFFKIIVTPLVEFSNRHHSIFHVHDSDRECLVIPIDFNDMNLAMEEGFAAVKRSLEISKKKFDTLARQWSASQEVDPGVVVAATVGPVVFVEQKPLQEVSQPENVARSMIDGARGNQVYICQRVKSEYLPFKYLACCRAEEHHAPSSDLGVSRFSLGLITDWEEK